MDQRQLLLRIGRKNLLLAGVEPTESIEEFNGRSGQVHNIVIDNIRADIFLRRRQIEFLVGVGSKNRLSFHLGFDGDSERPLFQQRLSRGTNELSTIQVKWSDKVFHLIASYGILHYLISVGVEIVCPDENLLPACWHGEGADAGHDVADHFARLKFLDQAAMLGLQTAVPVDTGIVKAELAVLLVLNDVQVVLTCQQLIWEGAELAVRTNIFGLIDDGANSRVLVQEDFGNYVLIWQIL